MDISGRYWVMCARQQRMQLILHISLGWGLSVSTLGLQSDLGGV